MIEFVDIRLSPEQAFETTDRSKLIAAQLNVKPERIRKIRLIKRSLDARKRAIVYQLRYEVHLDEIQQIAEPSNPYQDVSKAEPVFIIGCGPAGLFAALELIKKGLRPVIFERGKDVRSRRRDLAAINKEQLVNPESNYCFGEGGAGTYSDGKLYTRSTKRGDVKEVLQWLVEHGASEDILIDAHPHIGTNKLPKIIVGMRETIIAHGGSVHFEFKLTDILIKDGKLDAIEINQEERIPVENLILATGHSARDIFELLAKRKVHIEAKTFAMGVRVEHPQALIDQIQYRRPQRGEFLPPAAYRIVKQVQGRGVYSFCMCPGGIIAPCATAPGEIVTNGWSPSRRNNPYANSGIVVSVTDKEWGTFGDGPLAALRFQQSVETKAYAMGGNEIGATNGQIAPAQRLTDFIKGKSSSSLPDCSYQPGLQPTNLKHLFPGSIAERLRQAFQQFGQSMKGYVTHEALIVGTESRTSSPVRIPRNPESLEHPELSGLYPCGEGAGYAGGIVSAAIDGIKCARAIAAKKNA